MKTKLLLGSLGIVAILILVSFTNVVSVQSTRSNSITDSPLYSIRTQKAINMESKTILTSNYLGKGLNSIQFPLHDNRTVMFQKLIDRIRTMDDGTFNRFIDYAMNEIQHKDNLKAIDTNEFIKELLQIRQNTQNIIVNKDSNTGEMTIFRHWDPVQCWFPGKLLLIVTWILLIPLWIILFIIELSKYTTDCMHWCTSTTRYVAR